MTWLCCFIFAISAFLGKIISGKWINILTLFAGFYTVTIFFAGFNFFGMKDGTARSCMVMIVGIIFFTLGYILITVTLKYGKGSKARQITTSLEKKNTDYVIRKTAFYIILIFVSAYTLYRAYLTIQLLNNGWSYIQIRTIFFSADEMSTDMSKYGRSTLGLYLHLPLLYSLIILATIAIFKDIGIKKRKTFIYIVLANIALYAFSNGGREVVVYAMALTIISFFTLRKKQIRKNRVSFFKIRLSKNKFYLFAAGVLACVLVYLLSSGRSQVGEAAGGYALRSVYIYFCGYFPHLGVRLENISPEDFTYGNSFLLGLIKPFVAILRDILYMPLPDAYARADTMTSMLQNRVDIGGGMAMNAYVSPFYYFYIDFGFYSVIYESLLYGFFCGYVETNYKTRPNTLNLFIYYFALLGVLSSVVRWIFVHPSMAMIVYFIPLIFMKKKNINQSVAVGNW